MMTDGKEAVGRRTFVKGAVCAAAAAGLTGVRAADGDDGYLDQWQRETDCTKGDDYDAYMLDGNTRNQVSLEKLERAFCKVLREVEETKVGDVPAVWSVYNMGYVVKTRETLFSIDLVHRRAPELAPRLDFALITHNHSDHWRPEFYRKMDGAGKMVISNFLDNYGAADQKRGGAWHERGGFTRAVKTFRFRDVEIRTSLVDHNRYLIDFTTAFSIRVGSWSMYHTGDCGSGSESKLVTAWGRPDLWTFFPGCGIDVARAIRKVDAKHVVFGHLWELEHRTGRLTTPLIRAAKAAAASVGCRNLTVALWGDRIS